MKIRLDSDGLYFVLILMALVPLHQEVIQLVSYYYREIFNMVFILLLFMYRPYKVYKSIFNRKVYIEFLFLLLFPLIIVVTAMFDPMVNLYGDNLSEILAADKLVNPKLYIFRNAVIYLPMLLYIGVRGLSPSDINKIAGVSALIAPISIIVYIGGLDGYSLISKFERLITGQIDVEYNSYVPYLTFSILSTLYLLELNYKKYILLIKMSLMSLLMFVSGFIFYSSSRQSILLAVFYLAVFLVRNFSIYRLMNVAYYVIFFVTIYYSYEFLTMEFGENRKLMKLTVGSELTRFDIWVKGISMLNASDFFTGSGLTSVMVSGPHNDFIRWLQRVGLIFMFISFYPYFSVLFKSFFDFISFKQDKVKLYILCAVIFTPYHSIFGYPREDAYQAIWSFIGIAMWLGYCNYRRRNAL